MDDEVADAAAIEESSSRDMARVIYILYLCGFAAGVTAVVGVVMAYFYRDGTPAWLRSHSQFQIRTFWIAALYLSVSLALVFVLVGLVFLVLWLVWAGIRIARALHYLDRREAHPRITTWGW